MKSTYGLLRSLHLGFLLVLVFGFLLFGWLVGFLTQECLILYVSYFYPSDTIFSGNKMFLTHGQNTPFIVLQENGGIANKLFYTSMCCWH